MEIPPRIDLVQNLITEQSVNLLAGEEGCGKSLLAMNIAVSIVTGKQEWLGHKINQVGKVIFLNNELSFTDFALRLKSMASAVSEKELLQNLIVPKEVPALSECWDSLNQLCEREYPCLIIVDCLYFLHNRDENDSSSMKFLMRQFLQLRDRFGLAIILIHHTKKGARFQRMHNDLMRGSSVFSGAADTVLMLRRSAANESKRLMKGTKFRHSSDEHRACKLLTLDVNTFWFSFEGLVDEGEHLVKATEHQTAERQIDFKAVFGKDVALSRQEILSRCKALGFNDRTIDRLLKQGKDSGTLDAPKYGNYTLAKV